MDKGHGRRERRSLRTTSILTLGGKWPGLKQGFELTRTRTIKGQTTTEVAYGVTSLSPARADAATLLRLAREPWGIENQLHWVRAETLREDACRVRRGAAPQILAGLRNAVVHLLRTVDDNCRAALECLQMNPARAAALAGLPQPP